jgi:glycosyltransferase involved in cell wall biosynthesis
LSRILLFANTTWYLYNFRSALARAIREAGHEVIFVSPHDEYVTRLQERGDRWVPFELSRRGVNPLTELITVVRCARLYRRLRPDLVHHFTIKPVLYGSIASRLAGVPFVVNSVTGLGYAFVAPGWRGRTLSALARTLYRLALGGKRTRVIFENQTDLDAFVRLGLVAGDRAVVVPGTGVDPDEFQPTEEPEGEPVVLMASRMLWDKGVGDLVEAARILKGRRVRTRVVLVGAPDPGNPSSIAEKQLQAWTSSGVVDWRGRLEGMPEVYAGCHIVVLPSHREGLPRNLVEAAAAGRPIVATDVPGCRDVVRDGVNGLLVPPHDPAALAEALEALISSPERRRAMGARGREIAASVFSDDQVIRGTLRVYASLLSTPSPGTA